ncbi:MAG TPA: class II aldolase/adducin family protein [Burkholderiales bacterium]|nr:class II aldolase/adducin family protein [Burkholderiales bacterium]
MNDALRELAVANRILARENVVDAFGHVSIRHPGRPDRFFMSRSRAPELVTVADLMEFELDGTPVDAKGRTPYSERFIHGAIFEKRADVTSVIHNHSHEIIPYGITPVKLRPVLHVGAAIGEDVPVWDIRRKFGDTNLLVVNMDQGRDLAVTLGTNRVALMRGHGCAVAGRTLREAVFTAIYLQVNAKLQTQALNLSNEVQYLSPGELARTKEMLAQQVGLDRAWEYWTMRADRSGID